MLLAWDSKDFSPSEENFQKPFVGTFTAAQSASSSTAREMRGYAAALQIIVQQFPNRVKGSAVLLRGDNQGAIMDLQKFKSPVPEIHQILEEVFRLCCQYDFDLVARWIPREELDEADALSRQPDGSDWALSPELFGQIQDFFGVRPTIDLFASDKCHLLEKFVSQFYTPGCCAVDATRIDWRKTCGQEETAWIWRPLLDVLA